jgi:hypothetical protein
MVLGFKTKFFNGEPTNFEQLILDGIKIHSMREDPNNRWLAGLGIQMATGTRTKYYNQFNLGKPELQKVVSTQKVFMTYDKQHIEVTINGKYLMPHQVEQLIKNDGLSRERFIDWFFLRDAKGKLVFRSEWSGKIIHWTDKWY